MTEVVIRDVPIKFPFRPYKVQEDYMSKVLECLQQGVNGILESPTGTGKTLSLLCSSLAWQQAKKAQVQVNVQALLQVANASHEAFNEKLKNDINKSAGTAESEDGIWGRSLSAPSIIYASRTHSQLSQAMAELKRSQYNFVSAAVLGSRDQLCIHPDLSNEHGFMKIAMCRAKTKSKSCHYYNNTESKKYVMKDFIPKQVMDIEDLVKFGHKNQCCPYFTTKNMIESADIIFTPYNYLLNPQTRRQQGLNISNAVIILDEAHNIEKVCEEAASVQISSKDIALCIAEVDEVMKKFCEDLSKQEEESQTPPDFSADDLYTLKTLFIQLEKVIDAIKLDNVSGSEIGKKFPGSYMFEILEKAELVGSKVELVCNTLLTLAQYLATVNDSALARKGVNLEKFSDFLKVVYDSALESGRKSDLYYRVYIEPDIPKKEKRDAWFSKATKVTSSAKIIHFWCFSPGFTMRSLLQLGVHSVILTSGTLSPLHAIIAELDIPIPVQLENPHIIKPNQINVSVISSGPTKEQLTSVFKNRENVKYLSDLGRTLINFCRVIPGGVLVFFPSFVCLEKSKMYWMEHGLWSQLDAIKAVYTEPQGAHNLPEIIRNFNTALEKDQSGGAVFMAVMRGKVSEGMDFADARCRAVFITGLPYPPFKDPRVMLKQEYIDNMRKNKKGMCLTGRDWYELEATRAVNQAVGRVIRHADDFGAILFCDVRFEYPKIINTLSAWIRPQIIKYSEFGAAYGRVTRFFKDMGANPPKRAVAAGASFDYAEVKIKQKAAPEEKPQKENREVSLMGFLEKFKSSQPTASTPASPQGLLDALNTSSQPKTIDILRTVYNQPRENQDTKESSTTDEKKESHVEPPLKKRKLKIVPLKFDSSDADAPSTSHSNNIQERKKTTREYLEEVQNRVNKAHYSEWSSAVKSYNRDGSYEQMVSCLRKVFPDAKTRDLFIGFKRFIKPNHLKQFEGLCIRLFGIS